MTEFEANYLTLLRTQVEEEIQYLLNHGHNTENNILPCMFCVPITKGVGFRCNRLHELRNFQSSIAGQKGRTTKTVRRSIGKEVPISDYIQSNQEQGCEHLQFYKPTLPEPLPNLSKLLQPF